MVFQQFRLCPFDGGSRQVPFVHNRSSHSKAGPESRSYRPIHTPSLEVLDPRDKQYLAHLGAQQESLIQVAGILLRAVGVVNEIKGNTTSPVHLKANRVGPFQANWSLHWSEEEVWQAPRRHRMRSSGLHGSAERGGRDGAGSCNAASTPGLRVV